MISIRFDKSDFKKTFESLNPKMKKKEKRKKKVTLFCALCVSEKPLRLELFKADLLDFSLGLKQMHAYLSQALLSE